MRTSLRHLLLGTGAAGIVLAGAIGAPAATAADTTVTFNVPTGDLVISAQPTANLATVSNVVAGVTLSGSLGAVSITDTRNVTLGWSVTATAGTFTQQTDADGDPVDPTGAPTIPGAAATITGPASTTTAQNVATFVPGSTVAGTGVIAVATSVVGNNTASFAPTMSVLVPVNTPAGGYSGTVTTTAA